MKVSEREVTFINQSSSAETYFWDFGDGNTSSSENPVHTYDQDGTYIVQLTTENNCNTDNARAQV